MIFEFFVVDGTLMTPILRNADLHGFFYCLLLKNGCLTARINTDFFLKAESLLGTLQFLV
ncbi:hypothetical protein EGI22_13250 [Lacihabitans sp. LS3-19]|nr:hypothetical protein [Lacihabitans sp. LS3-19]